MTKFEMAIEKLMDRIVDMHPYRGTLERVWEIDSQMLTEVLEEEDLIGLTIEEVEALQGPMFKFDEKKLEEIEKGERVSAHMAWEWEDDYYEMIFKDGKVEKVFLVEYTDW